MPGITIADQAAAVLSESGPLDLPALTALLVERGATRAKNPKRAVLNAIEYHPKVIRLPGERYTSRDALLRGRVFTCRVTAEDLSDEAIPTLGDLSPLQLPIRTPLTSNRGDVQVAMNTRQEVRSRPLRGPVGWLADLTPGDLVSVRYDGSAVDVQRVEQPQLEPLVDRQLSLEISRSLEGLQGWDEEPTVPLAFQVHRLIEVHPTAFTAPGLPVSERLSGVEVHRGMAGLPGTDWSEWDWWDQLDDEPDDEAVVDEDVAAGFRLTGADAAALTSLVDAVREIEDGGAPPYQLQARALGGLLAQQSVWPAFAAWCQVEGDAESVLALATALQEDGGGAFVQARGLVLQAIALEALVRSAEAEACVDQALRIESSFELALEMALRYASDRGDAATAVRHLRALRVPQDNGELAMMRRFAEPPTGAVGRNAPCPCGSGKKHKLCCLGKTRHPLPPRAPWLWQKLATWAREPRQRWATLQVARDLSPDDPHDWVRLAVQDATTLDLAAWGGDLVAAFVRERGQVLPEDERELLDSWLVSPIRLLEVTGVRTGAVEARDRLTDEVLTVQDKQLSRNVEVGQVVAGRVLPDGGGGHIISFVLDVPELHRPRVAAILRGGEQPERALADWWAMAHRPQTLVDGEGNELVLCTGAWQVSDPEAARRALEARFGAMEHGTIQWLDGNRGLGELTLDGDQLEASTRSQERWAELATAVVGLLPDAAVLREDAVPASSILSGEVSFLPTPEEEPTAEMLQAMREHLETYERGWVDESIPALDGLTPRAALDDPAMRRVLLDMLRDMPEREGAMSAARIRGLLGLPD